MFFIIYNNLEKREDLKQNKSSEVKETRGRKKEKHFVELEFSLTKSNSYKNKDEMFRWKSA